MPLVPINITGQTYQSRSGQLSNQVCQNFYAELVEDPFGKAKYVLQPTPGMLLFGSAGSGVNRGVFEHQGGLYHVCGTSLYTVASDGTHTSRGTISGTDEVIFTALGANIIINANSGTRYHYATATTTLSTISDGDLESGNSCATLNNQVIYDGTAGNFGTSDVGDATSIDGLNYAAAESSPDNLIRVFVFQQFLWLFGDKTLEKWWNSGVGNPPFDRVEGAIIQVGLDAVHSVASNDNAMYWLGDDKQVYRMFEGSVSPVSNIAMHGKASAYATTSDAIGWTFTFEGQNFYQLTFPTQDVTWLFNEKTGWTTLSSGSSGGRSLANSYAFVFGKHIIGDYNSDNLYEWKATQYTDNFTPVDRIRDTATIHGGLYGKPGVRVEQNDLRVIMEVGTGTGVIAHMLSPGSSGDYLSSPDSASSSVIGDITIECKAALDNWSTGTSQVLIAKTNQASDLRSYLFSVGSGGNLQISTSVDGTLATRTFIQSSGMGLANGTTKWVKVTIDVNDGAGNNVTKFYTSDDGITWAQLGATVTTAGTISIDDNAQQLELGTFEDGVNNPMAGKLFEAKVYNGIDVNLVVHFDADDWVSGSTLTSAVTGEVWTINGGVNMVVGTTEPSITLAISDDGGNTFSSEISADVGAASDFQREVRWNALGGFDDGRILRIKSTSAVFTSIHGATSNISLGI